MEKCTFCSISDLNLLNWQIHRLVLRECLRQERDRHLHRKSWTQVLLVAWLAPIELERKNPIHHVLWTSPTVENGLTARPTWHSVLDNIFFQGGTSP